MWLPPSRALALALALPLLLSCSAPDPPDPDACKAPEVYAEPGCESPPSGDAALPYQGCFTPCTQAGAACASGGTCQKAWTNPCVCKPGLGCCDACGGEQLLCLP